MSTPDTGGFLGSLRSELDESDSVLHGHFETLAALAGAARQAYLEYRLKPETAAELFRMLRISTTDGREWTVGPTSGAWFARQPGSDWVRAALPVGLEPAYDDAPPRWLLEGIGEYLRSNEIDPESHAREVKEQAAAGPGAPEAADMLSLGAINPFQSKALDDRNLETAGHRASLIGGRSEDDEWLLEEWSSFDQELEKLRALRQAEESQRRRAPREKLPSQVPEELDADRALSEKAAPESAEPSEREELDFVNPEEFFLRPED